MGQSQRTQTKGWGGGVRGALLFIGKVVEMYLKKFVRVILVSCHLILVTFEPNHARNGVESVLRKIPEFMCPQKGCRAKNPVPQFTLKM